MKIKFSRKAGVISIIVAVAVFAVGGIILDRVHENRFTVEKLPDGVENPEAETAQRPDTKPESETEPEIETEPDGRININTADAAALATLDGIGESTAQRIVEFRQKNGEFMTVEELMRVNGIGEKKFDAIKDKICVK